jgi:hypothetical protein
MKILLRFIIPLISTALLGTLYLIFEVRILQLLSTWPKETEPQNILRTVIATASLLVFLLLYWIILLREKIKETPSLEILKFQKWEETEKQYEDKELYGHFFHVKKTSLESGGHPQYACPSCYQDKKESPLNYEIEPTPEVGRFLCPVCEKRVDWNNFDYSKQKS